MDNIEDKLEMVWRLSVAENETAILRGRFGAHCDCDADNDTARKPRSLLSVVYMHHSAGKTELKWKCRNCGRVYTSDHNYGRENINGKS